MSDLFIKAFQDPFLAVDAGYSNQHSVVWTPWSAQRASSVNHPEGGAPPVSAATPTLSERRSLPNMWTVATLLKDELKEQR